MKPDKEKIWQGITDDPRMAAYNSEEKKRPFLWFLILSFMILLLVAGYLWVNQTFIVENNNISRYESITKESIIQTDKNERPKTNTTNNSEIIEETAKSSEEVSLDSRISSDFNSTNNVSKTQSLNTNEQEFKSITSDELSLNHNFSNNEMASNSSTTRDISNHNQEISNNILSENIEFKDESIISIPEFQNEINPVRNDDESSNSENNIITKDKGQENGLFKDSSDEENQFIAESSEVIPKLELSILEDKISDVSHLIPSREPEIAKSRLRFSYFIHAGYSHSVADVNYIPENLTQVNYNKYFHNYKYGIQATAGGSVYFKRIEIGLEATYQQSVFHGIYDLIDTTYNFIDSRLLKTENTTSYSLYQKYSSISVGTSLAYNLIYERWSFAPFAGIQYALHDASDVSLLQESNEGPEVVKYNPILENKWNINYGIRISRLLKGKTSIVMECGSKQAQSFVATKDYNVSLRPFYISMGIKRYF